MTELQRTPLWEVHERLGGRMVVRQIDRPWMEEAELRESLPFQVQEFIPIPVEEAQLDFHVLEEFQNEFGAKPE